MEAVRIDRWLCAARIFKSRALAQQACGAGHVKINGSSVRASHAVRVGDEIKAAAPRGQVVLRVTQLSEKRQAPAVARALYEDFSPPPPPREPMIALRPRGAGRPTKADRRQLERFRQRNQVE